MRIEHLRVSGYGCLDALALDLGGAGLCVVAGPNEAGKTTLQTALEDLLFGFSTPELAFQGREALRLNARLVLGDGSVLEVERRAAGKSKDVLAGHRLSGGTSVPFTDFGPLLAGVTPELYRSVFGVTLKDLEQGADGLRGAGLDQVLAGGAIGGAAQQVAKVQGELTERLEEIFTSRARTKALNVLLDAVKQAAKDRDGALLKRDGLEQLEKELAEARARREDLDRESGTKRDRLSLVDAMGKACHDAVEWRSLRLEHAAGGTLRFTGDEAARVLEVLAGLREARSSERSLDAVLANRREAAAKYVFDRELVARAEEITALQGRLELVRSHRSDLPARRAELEQRRAVVSAKAEELGVEGTVSLLATRILPRSVTDEIDGALEAWAEARSAAQDAEASIRESRTQLANLEAQLRQREAGAASRELLAVVDQATPLKEWLTSRQVLVRAALNARGSSTAVLERLRPEPPIGAEAAAAVPSMEAIEVAARALEEAEQELRASLESLRDYESEAQATRAELAALLEQIGAARPESLASARAARDARWLEVRQSWLDGTAVIRGGQPLAPELLAAEYEREVKGADESADQLRLQAERVARIEALRVDEARRDSLVSGAARRKEDAAGAAVAARERWKALWAPAGIRPLSPEEMRGWAQAWEAALVKRAEASDAEREAEALGARIQALAEQVFESCGERVAPDGLPGFLARATREEDARSGALQTLRTSMATAETEASTAQERRGAAEAQVAQAAGRLASLWPRIGLPADLAPGNGAKWMEALRALVGEAGKVEAEAAAVEAGAGLVREFDERVDALVAALGRAATSRREEALGALAGELTEALAIRSKLQAVQEEIEVRARESASVAERARSLSKELEAIQIAARSVDEQELEVEARRAMDAARRQARLDQLDRLLGGLLGAGARREGAEAELSERSAEDLDREHGELEARLKAIDAERSEVSQRIGQLDKVWSDLGGDAASLAEARRQAKAAEARRLAAEVARLRIARLWLGKAVDRHARESRPALLARASNLIKGLTEGRWVAVERATTSGAIELVQENGVRRGPGALSRGTMEQLFLAMRLGFALERGGVEQLPLILDDVLVNFDTRRQRAAIATLGEVAKATQVILLTCHEHIAGLVGEIHGVQPVALRPG